MKIISNGEVYIQKNDLEHAIVTDPNFPLDIYAEITSTIPSSLDYKQFIKVTNEEAKKYIRNCKFIPSFRVYYSLCNEELLRIKKILTREYLALIDEVDNCRRADAQIKRYKKKRVTEYLLSQVSEMIAYKEGKSTLDYPNVPNPGHRVFNIGNLNATLSLQNGKIIGYPVAGKKLSDIPSLAFNVAIEELKNDLRDYNIEAEYDIKSDITEDNKYLVSTFERTDIEKKERNQIKSLEIKC